MKNPLFVFVFLLLMMSSSMAQTMLVDSLKDVFLYSKNDTARLISLKEISKLYEISYPDSSLYYAHQMLSLAREKRIFYYASDAHDLISNVYEQEGKLKNSILYTDSARYFAELINDTLGIIFFTNNKASIYIKMGKYFEALQTFEEVIQISESANDPAGKAAALNNMGVVYHYLGDDKTSLNYFIDAYEIRLKNNVTNKLAYSLNNIGAIYSKYGNYSEALDYHEKAMQTAQTNSDDYNYLVALINLGLDYDFLNNSKRSLVFYNKALGEAKRQNDKTLQSHVLERISSVYLKRNNTPKAKLLLVKALKIARTINNEYDIAAFSNSLGMIYLKEKNYPTAHSLFLDALSIAKKINASKIETDVYKSLAAYYYSVNNSEKAFAYQKLFDTKRDSLYNAETDLKIANLKNRFELDRKMDELELKEVELSSVKKINKERLQIIYVISLSAFAVLILAIYILFLYGKIKIKNQIIRQSEETVKILLEKEKELGKLKTQLISTVSHEFRTPMAIISSNAQLLRDYLLDMDEKMRKQTLAFISDGVENMTAMMNNFELLDKQTILEFKPEKIIPATLLKTLCGQLQSIDKYNNRIVISNNLGDAEYYLDKILITHIVRNLLINALKFSGDEKINLSFTEVENGIEIQVSDKGIGMSDFDRNNIFENFHRGTNAQNIKGTGVGMSVVKRCVNLHDGKILVESHLNKGTTISVFLPT